VKQRNAGKALNFDPMKGEVPAWAKRHICSGEEVDQPSSETAEEKQARLAEEALVTRREAEQERQKAAYQAKLDSQKAKREAASPEKAGSPAGGAFMSRKQGELNSDLQEDKNPKQRAQERKDKAASVVEASQKRRGSLQSTSSEIGQNSRLRQMQELNSAKPKPKKQIADDDIADVDLPDDFGWGSPKKKEAPKAPDIPYSADGKFTGVAGDASASASEAPAAPVVPGLVGTPQGSMENYPGSDVAGASIEDTSPVDPEGDRLQRAKLLHALGRYSEALAVMREGETPTAPVGEADSVDSIVAEHRRAMLFHTMGRYEDAVNTMSPRRLGSPCTPRPDGE